MRRITLLAVLLFASPASAQYPTPLVPANGDGWSFVYNPKLYGGTDSGDDITINATSHATPGDIVLQSAGGNIIIGGGTSASEVHLLEPSGGGGSAVKLKSPALAADITFTLPNAYGTAGYVLSDSDGAGTLTWVAAGGGTPSLQDVYDNGAAGNQIILLDATNDSIEIDNPASSGTSSTHLLKLDNNHVGGISALVIESSAADKAALSVTSNGDGNYTRSGLFIESFAGSGAASFTTGVNGTTSDTPLVTMQVQDATYDQAGLEVIYGGASDAISVTNTGSGASINAGDGAITNVGDIALDSISADASTITITPAAGSNLNVVTSGAGNFAVNTTELVVDNGVGVGIGTANPSVALDVQLTATGSTVGSRTFNQSQTNGASHARHQVVTWPNGGDAFMYFAIVGATDWATGIDNSDSDKFKIGTSLAVGTNTHLTIDTSGNVGIGDTSPDFKLEVAGSIGLQEQAAADADEAGTGQIWVKNDTPNELYFTDDAGTDTQISSHADDGPDVMYSPRRPRGITWCSKRVIKYKGVKTGGLGELNGQGRTVDGAFVWDNLLSNPVVESFDEYATRHGSTVSAMQADGRLPVLNESWAAHEGGFKQKHDEDEAAKKADDPKYKVKPYIVRTKPAWITE